MAPALAPILIDEDCSDPNPEGFLPLCRRSSLSFAVA
jgi:hypothetical protein